MVKLVFDFLNYPLLFYFFNSQVNHYKLLLNTNLSLNIYIRSTQTLFPKSIKKIIEHNKLYVIYYIVHKKYINVFLKSYDSYLNPNLINLNYPIQIINSKLGYNFYPLSQIKF